MELAIPILALGGLYIISNQKKDDQENFQNNVNTLPNTDLPNRNFPDENPPYDVETDLTSKLSNDNSYIGKKDGAYTDKYFLPDSNQNITSSYAPFNNSISSNDNTASYYSLSGQRVGADYFQHNNMQPYFGSHIRSRNTDANVNESTIDVMTGAGSQIFSKKEQAPMFAPGENLQYAYGMPNHTDFVKSRMNPALKMSNVTPFDQIQVAPGLGLGYTAEGQGGFNSGTLARDSWLPKTVDELRVDNKPRTSNMLLGLEGAAKSYNTVISNRDIIGRVEKNRVDTTFELGADRLFTTTGIEIGPTIHARPIDRYVSRPETTTAYSGVAGKTTEGVYVAGEYMPSTNAELGAFPFLPAGASGKNAPNEGEFGRKSMQNYMNNRSFQQEDYFGGIKTAVSAIVSPVLDILRPTRKEDTIGNLRPYQNVKATVPGTYIYDPTDTPVPTIREMTEVNSHNGYMNRNQRGGAYETTTHQGVMNQRDTTNQSYSGVASYTGANAPVSLESAMNQRNNDIKSSTIDGYMVKGNMNLFNGDVNQRGKEKAEYLQNTRTIVGSYPTQNVGVENMGALQGQQQLYQNIQLDRNNGDVMGDVLNKNPFVIPYRQGL